MTTNFGLTTFQARRQALINLALKRDPVPIRQKPVVSFDKDLQTKQPTIAELPPTNASVNELPPIDTYNKFISSPSHEIVDELPPVSPIIIIPTSARSISSLSPIA
jgi:hypothetical protein